MKKDSWLVVCDLDGTLMEALVGVPEENIRAIRRFTEQGGGFTVATGRSVVSAAKFLDRIDLTLPGIYHNGACIYDHVSRRRLYTVYLAPRAEEYVRALLRQFPSLSAIAVGDEDYYNLSDSDRYVKAFSNLEKMAIMEKKDVPAGFSAFYKVLFCGRPEDMAPLKEFALAQRFDGVRFVESSDWFLEMIPEGISKGAALEKLVRLIGVPMQRVAAVGNQHNDCEMLQTAGLGAAVQEAPELVRQSADIVLGGCLQGAVAQLLFQLEQQK